jgi:hypothetical protein
LKDAEGEDLPVSRGRTRWAIAVLGLVVLAVAPFTFTTSWKRALAGIAAFLLAISWVLFWWAIRDPRRRVSGVAFVLGVIGGLVLGGLGSGLYCQAAHCERGFDALVLVPAGALLGAVMGGVIGLAVADRLERGSHEPRPSRRPDGLGS